MDMFIRFLKMSNLSNLYIFYYFLFNIGTISIFKKGNFWTFRNDTDRFYFYGKLWCHE